MEKEFDSVAMAALAAVNSWPGLGDGERFRFATLGEDGGLGMFPGPGVVLESESRSVTGRVRQIKDYPFTLALRAGGLTAARREDAQTFLEALGRYLEGEGGDFCLAAYPALSGKRRILGFRRVSAPKPDGQTAGREETWVMDMTAKYETILN